MEQWPYGANILIKSSNSFHNIPAGQIDFITSRQEAVTMTFNYEEVNGTLVEINTNLRLVSWDNKHPKGSFTLSNDNFNDFSKKPYIYLCCNNVKVPITFVDTDNTGNKWYTTEVNSDSIMLKGKNNDYVKVAKEVILNWNTSTEQQIFIEKNTSTANSEFYGCQGSYLYLNNNNLEESKDIIWQNTIFPTNGKITIPRLDGISSQFKANNTSITKKFYKYFMLGIQVKILDGYSTYKTNSNYYIKDTNIIYDNTGFLKTVKGIRYLESDEKGALKILSNSELDFKWHSDFFFTTKNGEYISPSSSKIYINYDIVIGRNCPEHGPICNCNSDARCKPYTTIGVGCTRHTICSLYYSCECYGYEIGDEYYKCKEYYDCYSYERGSCKCNNYCSCDFYELKTTEYSCYQDYDCKEVYNGEYYEGDYYRVFCPCYTYGEYKSNNGCISYCECNLYHQEECPYNTIYCLGYCNSDYDCEDDFDDCSSETYCGSDNICSTHGQQSGGTITVPGLRTVNGVKGADCTRRTWSPSQGVWVFKEVFIPAGTYPIENNYGWPCFWYNGYYYTYP